jgi:capsular exopolysaccharide synthesis family protein
MSKFFKALEQAERERALREQGQRQEPKATPAAASAPAASREEPPSARMPLAAAPPAAPSEVDRLAGEGIRRPTPRPASELSEARPDGMEEHLVSLLAPTSFEAEQYRALRHLVEQLRKTAGLSVVAVSSAEAADGKTTTAINLAGALAQAPETRVLLVDVDLRRSSVKDFLGLGHIGGRGLVDAILTPGIALEDVVRHCPPFNLSVLPAGRHPASPYELLKSSNLGGILEEARQRYDYVVLDTPPLVPYPDCRVIGKWVDGFIVVVAAHKTPRKLVEEALQVMDPAKIVGLIFNRDDRPVSGYYYYASPQTPGGARPGWWVRTLNRVSGSGRRRGPSWPGRKP